jgi:hypothetical protein
MLRGRDFSPHALKGFSLSAPAFLPRVAARGAAENSWIITPDNMSRIPEWLSNTLCTIVYHGGFGLRMNYTDEDEQLFDAIWM